MKTLLDNSLNRGNKSEIVAWGYPNYSASYDVLPGSESNQNTAETNGWILLTSTATNTDKIIWIEGIDAAYTYGPTFSFMVPVAKGQKWWVQCGYIAKLKFIPAICVPPPPQENFTIVGTVSITDGVTGSMDNSNYIYSDDISIDTTKPWEFRTKINVTTLSSQNGIIALYDTTLSTGNVGLSVCCPWDGKFKLYASTDGGWSWDIANAVTAENALTAEQDLFLNIGWNGLKYYIETSTDGITFTPYIEIPSSTAIKSCNKIAFGNVLTYTETQTEFDFQNTEFENDDNVIWTPYS